MEELEKSTSLSPDQIRRGVEWLRLKDFANVSESKTITLSLGKTVLKHLKKACLKEDYLVC